LVDSELLSPEDKEGRRIKERRKAQLLHSRIGRKKDAWRDVKKKDTLGGLYDFLQIQGDDQNKAESALLEDAKEVRLHSSGGKKRPAKPSWSCATRKKLKGG